MHYIPLCCTSSPCTLLFLNLGVYGLVQVVVGTVLVWYFCVACTGGGGGIPEFFLREYLDTLRRVLNKQSAMPLRLTVHSLCSAAPADALPTILHAFVTAHDRV